MQNSKRTPSPALREAIRRSRSLPILDRIHRALNRFQRSRIHLQKSLLSKAISYALGQWPRLTVFVSDSRIEPERSGDRLPQAARRVSEANQIDNNLVENSIRPTAMGKKNWLFIGDKEAGWHSAVIYSIITNCRNRGIDPYAYLRNVLTRLPSMTNRQISGITPAAWAASQSQIRQLAS